MPPNLKFFHRDPVPDPFTTIVDINTQPSTAPPQWRKAAASHDHTASANIMSRKLATRDPDLRIENDTEDHSVVVGQALGKRVKLRGWINAEWASQGSQHIQTSRFLLTMDDDPPFDIVLAPKPDTQEEDCESDRGMQYGLGEKQRPRASFSFGQKWKSGLRTGTSRSRLRSWSCF